MKITFDQFDKGCSQISLIFRNGSEINAQVSINDPRKYGITVRAGFDIDGGWDEICFFVSILILQLSLSLSKYKD